MLVGKPPKGMKVLAEGESYLESRVISICCGIKTSTGDCHGDCRFPQEPFFYVSQEMSPSRILEELVPCRVNVYESMGPRHIGGDCRACFRVLPRPFLHD